LLSRLAEGASDAEFRGCEDSRRLVSLGVNWSSTKPPERILQAARGVPELVPAPALEHRVEAPHLVQHSPVGGLLYQRVLIYVKNVGNEIARVTNAVVNTNVSASLRSASAVAPGDSEPFEINALVTGEDGLPAGTEFMLRITYEGGGRRRELLSSVRYYRSGGFENLGVNIWEA
jgi:hypothetical protein